MVGIYDSGLGGVSVLAAVRDLDPTADILYLADQLRAPYGDRPLGELLELARRSVDVLAGRGAETIVLASNTISNAALHALRQERPDLTLVGMEPAIKPAVALTTTGTIAVLATTRTIDGPLLAAMVEQHGTGTRVVPVALPGLVELIEDGLGSSHHVEAFLRAPLRAPMEAGADVYVLACTHYSFAADAVRSVTEGAIVVDPSEAVARQAARVRGRGGSGTTVVGTTGDVVRFRRQLGEVAPGLRLDGVEEVSI